MSAPTPAAPAPNPVIPSEIGYTVLDWFPAYGVSLTQQVIDNDADYQRILALRFSPATAPHPVPVDFNVQTIALIPVSLPCGSYHLVILSVRETEADIEVNYTVRNRPVGCFPMFIDTASMVLFDNVRRVPVRIIARW